MLKNAPNQIAEILERVFRLGPTRAMREDETMAGNTPVIPGEVFWLKTCDWPDDIVVSQNKKTVRIIAIRATTPGNGAFSRLITEIAKAGLKPVVVEPMELMTLILRRWGWSHRVVGKGMQHEDQWRPSKAWLEERATKCITTDQQP